MMWTDMIVSVKRERLFVKHWDETKRSKSCFWCRAVKLQAKLHLTFFPRDLQKCSHTSVWSRFWLLLLRVFLKGLFNITVIMQKKKINLRKDRWPAVREWQHLFHQCSWDLQLWPNAHSATRRRVCLEGVCGLCVHLGDEQRADVRPNPIRVRPRKWVQDSLWPEGGQKRWENLCESYNCPHKLCTS